MAALCARVLLPELGNGGDPELSLPMLASNLMPDVLAGLFLAGLFAAAMSTADSQVLSSSAALTRDLFQGRKKDSLLWSKSGTIFVASLALLIAVSGDKNVMGLALYGWSVMAAGMGPMLFVYMMGGKPSQPLAVLMMLTGAAMAIGWEESGLSGDMYSVLPGVLASLTIYVIGHFVTKKT